VAEFRNPSAGGGGSQDNRSFLVMMVVMIGVILGLQYWRAQHAPPAPVAEKTTTAAPVQTPEQSAGPAAAATAVGTTATNQVSVPTVQAAAESTTTVENELYKITFSNRGGDVRSWILKRFKNNEGKPLDLVSASAAKLYGYPLSLYTYDTALTQQLGQALYVPSVTGNVPSPTSISFDYSAGNVVVKKTFSFGADYVIHADTLVTRNGAPIRALVSWPSGLGDMETPTAHASSQIDSASKGKDEHTAFKKVSGGATLEGPFDFAGLSDQYFGAIFLPDTPADATFVTLHNQVVMDKTGKILGLPPADDKAPKGELLVPVLGAAVGSVSGHDETRLFVGPKDIDVLKSVHAANGSTLESVLDFGFWGPIGKFLFLGLHAVHAFLPHANLPTSVPSNFSWGWAIVIFTILINLVLLPLRVQGMKSAVKMQRIQPLIDAIKAKYKNPGPTDPRAAEMNAEIMKTQKEHGVSMFGGCIPSLIQLPLLLAFFTMMNHVVELRQAHFFWLPDLSAADPWHILPIMMLITSFLAQYYTPSPGVDPQQQKMMAFMMPVFSCYMTWAYASGLALYWNIGNLVMIAQQQVMNRTSLGQEMREIAAARAKRKAVGTAKPGARTPPQRTIQGRR
jgi:YidC/Oxa1 family membrane protein insertase